MKVGVISDTHDDLRNTEASLDVLHAEGVTTLLHCGDVCGPGIVQVMMGFDVWIARGNMDRHPDLTWTANEALGVGRLARRHQLTLDGYAVAMLHGDDEAELKDLIASAEYAYVFHGHTHRRRDEMVGPTRVINPGALGGMRWQQRSFCILDLKADEARFVRM